MAAETKTGSETEIQRYMGVDSTFVDYRRFEGDKEQRVQQRDSFLNGESWDPEYDYPKLDALYDVGDDTKDENETKDLSEKKHNIQEAVLNLEAAKAKGEISEDELNLYIAFHELRLKRIMLIESARRLHHAGSSAELEVSKQEFMNLNRETYGEYDTELFEGMLNTEKQRLDSFEPKTEIASNIKAQLDKFFEGKHTENREAEILSDELLEAMRQKIEERYGHILGVVPDTDDSVIYDAGQCKDIMEMALEAGGLADKGWKIVIDPKKSNPSTAANFQKISIPSDTARTAAELRRLILHEQEVHARRGQNGEDAGIELLKKGTADYADVEEGLGVLLECVLAGNVDNPSYHRARDRYITAGLALGADGTPRDARQTFEILWRLQAVRQAKDGVIDESVVENAKKGAYVHIENAFRGTNFAMQGIIYTKIKVYYEGLVKNSEFFEDNIDDLDEAIDTAMLGKINHTNPKEVGQVKNLVQEKLGH